MTRLVRRTLQEPTLYVIDGKDVSLCKCGLSKNQPSATSRTSSPGARSPAGSTGMTTAASVTKPARIIPASAASDQKRYARPTLA